MKFGLRTPSLKKRVSARTSWKRAVRHRAGLKAPKGAGVFTNPKKAMYNKVYNRTTLGVGDIGKSGSISNKRKDQFENSSSYIPVDNDAPFALTPHSFIEQINERKKFGKDGWAKLIVILGVLFLIGNPILGIPLAAGGGFWLYKMSKTPWYRYKENIAKAKKLLKSDKFDEAIPLLKAAQEVDSNSTEMHYLLGVAEHAIGEYKKSIEHLSAYVDSASSDLDAKLVLAYSYYKLEQYQDTIPLLQEFPENYPDNLLVILLLGDSYIGLKEYDMAIITLKRGPTRKTKYDPSLLQLHYLLGIAYKGKGQNPNAIRELKRVYAFDMNYKDVAIQLEKLGADS